MNGTAKTLTDSEFLSQIGAKIAAIRRFSKVKQEDFADSIGLTQGALSKYEAGKINIPVLSLKAISDKYNVRITDFFIFQEKPSTLFKRMLKVSAAPYKYDKIFDEYMSRPENADKRALLYYMSHIIDMNILSNNKETQQQLVLEVERAITYDTDHLQKARLMRYAKALQQLQRKSNESN